MKLSRLFTYLFIGLLAYWVIGLFASPPPVFAQTIPTPAQVWYTVH